jgi:PAS domain S-box-containing protein
VIFDYLYNADYVGVVMLFEGLQEKSEKLLHCLFEEASLGIAVEDTEGKLLLTNRALCSMLGYSNEELCRMSCSEFTHPEDSEDDWALFQKLRAGTIDRYSLEKRYVKRDGTQIWGRLNVSILRSGEEPSLVIAFVEDITERKQTEEALSRMTHRSFDAQEQERSRIARELHDDFNQRLAMLAIGIEQFRRESLPDGVLSRLDELHKYALELSDDVQALAHELHSPKLNYLGIVSAMSSFCRAFSERQNVKIDFSAEGLTTVPSEISLCLFRVLQEALHNALKHSGVRHFTVELRGAPDAVQLTVRDSGVGFDPDAAAKSSGLGLTSMKERVKLVGGIVTVNSRHDGTTIQARVPLRSGTDAMRASG